MTSSCSNASPIPILVYHQIDQAPARGAPHRGLYVSPNRFAQQMRWLKRLGYRGLSMAALMPYLRGEQLGRVVGITFDDGYVNNLTHALPVLQALDFSSTCYAVSGQIGGQNVWDKEVGIAQVPLMDVAQMQAWLNGGQEIGAHSCNHVHLDQVDSAQHEISHCKQQLEAALQAPVTHFCYPYGDFNAANVAQVAAAGFASATTTRRGRVHAGADLLRLNRIPVHRSTHILQFLLKIFTSYEDRK